LIVLVILPGVWLLEGASRSRGDQGKSGSWRWMSALRESMAEVVLPLLLDENTRYARDYRENIFRALKPGTTEASVHEKLGEPLARRSLPDGETVWYYSEQATATDNYLLRNVVFDGQGRLLRKVTEFYVD
jgi:hypothetical protein